MERKMGGGVSKKSGVMLCGSSRKSGAVLCCVVLSGRCCRSLRSDFSCLSAGFDPQWCCYWLDTRSGEFVMDVEIRERTGPPGDWTLLLPS
ncbi:uncharacterized protein HHUB_4162 (plasmid) [Halobacterium hubeiense]|uniref:Uncharacterized protein n=1 Tax=Halobacterium hubeiense TaxID=1407499 RepID=A0A0U5H8E0_9EURY|nr:uncharacterized protein HHUB_4162 [Halobacterium hubeiense]